MEFHVIVPVLENSASWYDDLVTKSSASSILELIYNNAKQSGALNVIVATDNHIIRDAAEKVELKVCLIEKDDGSVTEKVAEVVEALELDEDEIVVCLDAENFLVSPKLISSVVNDLDEHANLKVSSCCEPITKVADMNDHSVVKVVLNKRQHAVYFSRSPIPFDHKQFLDNGNVALYRGQCFRHVGIYAFRVGFLRMYMEWAPCVLEKIEMLEQLRILYNGARIHMRMLEKPLPRRVKSIEDLNRLVTAVT
jgi:3-deoxy-manno-octulosonate cytidylyltransferase (CMP-KDO synthetase)